MQQASQGTTESLGFRALVAMQFLTSFNDNAFRIAITLLAYMHADTGMGGAIAALAAAVFLLPYALLSIPAGVLADHFPKKKVIVYCKLLEVPMVLGGLWGLLNYHQGSPSAMIFMLLMLTGLGVQSAFISPSRYGLLPEFLEDRELAHGNGDLELGSYMGMLSGMMVGGLIVEGIFFHKQYGDVGPVLWWSAVIAMPLASLAGLVSSLLLPATPAANPQRPLRLTLHPNHFWHTWKVMGERPRLHATVAGLSLFWGLSMLYSLATPYYGDVHLGFGAHTTQNTPLLLAISIGIGVGSYIAGKASRGGIEMGLIFIGAILWMLSALGLSINGLFGHVTSVGPDGVPQTFEHFGMVAWWLALAGLGAGFFVVPLNAYLEKYSPPEQRASCVAASNIVTVLAMLVACLFHYVAVAVLRLPPKIIFLLVALLLLWAITKIFYLIADYLVRLFVTILTRLMYRVRVYNIDKVPTNGPALLVFNHASFADGNLVVSIFCRFVRFVIYQGHYNSPALKFMGEAVESLPVDAAAPPRQILQALRKVSDTLNRGELCAIFAEGSISRVGAVLPFQRGMEQIMKHAPGVPIIPAYIDGMWGSIFSYHRRLFFKRWPESWRRRSVRVMFGDPLPSTASSQEVRQKVLEVGAACFALRRQERVPLHRQFLRTARKYPKRRCIADSRTPMMTHGKTLISAVAFSRMLRRKLGPEKYIGLLVPPSVGGVLANVAVAFLGKVAVNLNYTIGEAIVNNGIAQTGIKQVLTSRAFLEKVPLKPNAELIFLEDLRKELRLGDKLLGLAARYLPPWLTERWLLGIPHQKMDDLATIIFSSGSTGMPKGVMLTYDNVASNIDQISQAIDLRAEDMVVGVLPFFHSFGYTVTLWLPLLKGVSAIYHFNPLEPEVVGKLVRDYKATVFISTATFLRSYIRKCEKDDFRSLRLLVCGAEKLPLKVAEQFEHRFGVRPYEGYGCTELSPAVATNRDNEYGANNYMQIGHKPGTVGRPMPGQVVRIVEPTTYEVLPLGREGLLQVKGPNVMQGYFENPEATAEAVRDGWYNTGDIAKLDDDGFITITDRISRFSKIGGEMVPHGKVEDLIHEVLGTTERLCAVVGVPDPRKGERLVVIHTPLPVSINQVWQKLKECNIPPLWVPAPNAFFEVAELPVLGTGKTDIKSIKNIATERVGT